MRLKNIIVDKLYRFILLNLERLNFDYQKAKVDSLRKLKDFNINSGFILGEYSFIERKDAKCALTIGEDVVCSKFCNFLLFPGSSLSIGKGVFFNNYCSINCLGLIEIGDHTIFGEGVKIYDHNHLYNSQIAGNVNIEQNKFDIGHVKIGKNCWIGSNVTILNNVEIGDNVIVGANCLVFKSLPANVIVKHREDLILNN